MTTCFCHAIDATECLLGRLETQAERNEADDLGERCECVCHVEAREDERDEEDARGDAR